MGKVKFKFQENNIERIDFYKKVYFYHNSNFDMLVNVLSLVDKHHNSTYNNIEKVCARCDDGYHI